MEQNNRPQMMDTSRDTGFTNFLGRVYGFLALALAISALAAYSIMYLFPEVAFVISTNRILFYGLLIVEFLLAVSCRFAANRSAAMGTLIYLVYSILSGITLGLILPAFQMDTIYLALGGTVLAFGATSIYGMTTKRNLSGMGQVLIAALIGVIVATIINIFVNLSVMDMILNYAVLIIFSGLAAYDTQKLKFIYSEYGGTSSLGGLAVACALELYLDVINIFIALLRIFGRD